jgi:3-dehydroquinate dehydratase-2
MKNGTTIFLNASLEMLNEHLGNSSNPRPLLKVKTLEQIYDERISLYYEFADYIINYTDYESVGNKIMEIIECKNKKRILVVNGPNLNMLGLRDPKHYGTLTLEDINNMISDKKCFEYDFFQSNHEGAIVDKIQEYQNYDAIIINPAAYTHTSVAIHDALEIVDILKVEVHLSEVDSREEYRKVNFIRDAVDATFQGEKELSYLKAVEYLKNKLNVL